MSEFNLSDDVLDEELEEEFNYMYSYDTLLEKAISYIRKECNSGKIDDVKIRRLIARLAKTINNANDANVNDNRQEIKDIKGLIVENVKEREKSDYPVMYELNLVDKLNSDLKTELYEFIKSKFLTDNLISKRKMINYIFAKNKILPQDEIEIYQYKSGEFAEYLVKKHFPNGVTLTFNDMIEMLNDIIDDENYKNRFSTNGDTKTKYPSLARALLLINTKEGIETLIDEYADEPKFVEYLKVLLSSLSNYDKAFINDMKITIPSNEMTNILKNVLKYEIENNSALKNGNDENIRRKATYDSYEDKSKYVEGFFTVKEIMSCLPDDFKDKMYIRYNEVGDNEYAILLSKIIAKYCSTKDGKKYSPNKVQILLLNAYQQYIEKISKEFEIKPTPKK